MKQAVFITGFNNWGKTSLIQHFFNDRTRFFQGWHYRINGVNANFTVETHSNDDYWGQSWSDKVQERLDNEPLPDLHLFSALCPTIHDNNNFVNLLSNTPFNRYDGLHVFLIEYKWEHHAKLMIDNIMDAGRTIPNVNFITIDADQTRTTDQTRWDAKTRQILQELVRIFP